MSIRIPAEVVCMPPTPVRGVRLCVYRISYIDFWSGWSHAHDRVRIDFSPEPGMLCDDLRITQNEWESRWCLAKYLAGKVGWEGDIREGPYVAGLPVASGPDKDDFTNSEFLIGWKQDNNGRTFIASPVELPWLKDTCEDWSKE